VVMGRDVGISLLSLFARRKCWEFLTFPSLSLVVSSCSSPKPRLVYSHQQRNTLPFTNIFPSLLFLRMRMIYWNTCTQAHFLISNSHHGLSLKSKLSALDGRLTLSLTAIEGNPFPHPLLTLLKMSH
jgi:hypothetical protein